MNHEDIQKAVDWLINNADSASEARANRLQLEDFSKALLAQIAMDKQCEFPDAAGNALERMALADSKYEAHLAGLKEARRLDERFKWLNAVAHAKIELFRTTEATKRALKV